MLDQIDAATEVSAAETDADYEELFSGIKRNKQIEVDAVINEKGDIKTTTIQLNNSNTRFETKACKKLEKTAQQLRDQIYLTEKLIAQRKELGGSTPKIPLTKSCKAPGPSEMIKSSSGKPQVKSRVNNKAAKKAAFTKTFNPSNVFVDPVWQRVKPKDMFETSSDSGLSTQSSDDSIQALFKEVTPAALYQPNIVSIHALPKWDEVMETRVEPEVPFTKLTEVIANHVGTHWFAPIFGSATALFVSSLATSLLTIGTAFATLRAATKTAKFLTITTIVSSLVTFIVTLTHLFNNSGVSFNSEKVIKQIPQLATAFISEVKANSLSWIYPAITAIVSVIIGGLTVFNICDVKDVIQKGMLVRSTQHVSNVAKDITKFLLEDLLHLDITGDQEAHMELHKWAKRSAELAVLPYLDFLKNQALLLELENAVTKSIPIWTHKYGSKELSVTSRAAYSLVLQNIQRLTDKLAAIKIILGAVCD